MFIDRKFKRAITNHNKKALPKIIENIMPAVASWFGEEAKYTADKDKMKIKMKIYE